MKHTEKLTLADVQEQFEHWRTTRQQRSPIPQELWDAALSLVGRHSTLEISKALNLAHSKLKQRINFPSSSESPPPPDFVKVGIVQQPTVPPSCVLEVSDKNGAAMRVSMTGVPCLNIMELVEAFWRRKP